MTITGDQVKAARELLGWTLLDLGYRADVSEATIAALEMAQRTTRPDKLRAIRRALESAGIEFIAEQLGVKMKKPKLTILPGQCRAARGLIGINQAQLANLASISRTTVIEFETSKRVPGADFVQAIQRALEAAGVAFTNGGEPGVKLRKPE